MIVIWSENAKNNLQDYKQNSQIITEGKVENYINSLIDYIDNLENFDTLGKFLFHKNDFEIRQLLYSMHRIFYAINNNKIYILMVSHTARDINNIIKYLKNKNFNDFI